MLILDNLGHNDFNNLMCFTFHVAPGERLAILGPSGSGKSTLLNLIAGFLTVSSGKLTFNDQDISHLHPSKRPISILFQENNLFPHLTVEQNIGLGIHPGLRLNGSQRYQLVEIIKQMELEGLQRRLPEQLSGGQRQRVALARCLVRQQPILLLDEPFSALDPALRSEMLAIVKAICQQRNITLLMISHNLEDVSHIANRSLLIVDGKVSWYGESRQLLSGEVPQAKVLGLTSVIKSA